ncbi:putative rRNA methylase YtqB, partial [Impatiens glandulifera]|uniref:putative rRNA methylase YtqB n=1 Tax=Impatiens glandulifera TaxID=253017 RepID=UPI001FB0CF1C
IALSILRWVGSGLEDVMIDYILGKTKATEVAHLAWKYIVQKGDTVVDATCGNGHDTLALVKLVTADKTQRGRVYSLDVQKFALEKTLALLDESLDKDEKEIVKLVETCHSRMHEVVPKGEPVRVVAFNLGYLPGGDKALITGPKTTLMALESAKDLLTHGGLISVVGYVGHPGGREEFETVREFGSRLPVDEWSCCELRMLNRPLAPVLVFMFKK